MLENKGNFNTAIGKGALNKSASGTGNTALGTDALYNNEGNGNIAIGYRAGNGMTGGTNNVLIGDSVQASTPTADNEVVIGNDNIEKTRLKGSVTVGDATWSGGGTDGLGIQASSNSSSPYAFYIRNSDNNLLTSVRCNGDTSIGGNLSTSGSATFSSQVVCPSLPTVGPSSAANLFVNAAGALYKVTGTLYSTQDLDNMFAQKDKLIEKLEARLTKLEARNK